MRKTNLYIPLRPNKYWYGILGLLICDYCVLLQSLLLFGSELLGVDVRHDVSFVCNARL